MTSDKVGKRDVYIAQGFKHPGDCIDWGSRGAPPMRGRGGGPGKAGVVGTNGAECKVTDIKQKFDR